VDGHAPGPEDAGRERGADDGEEGEPRGEERRRPVARDDVPVPDGEREGARADRVGAIRREGEHAEGDGEEAEREEHPARARLLERPGHHGRGEQEDEEQAQRHVALAQAAGARGNGRDLRLRDGHDRWILHGAPRRVDATFVHASGTRTFSPGPPRQPATLRA
jgi:hypothetical protein